MVSCRVPMLRHLVSCQMRTLRASNQRRWAQVHDVRFLATTQPVRNLLEKYRDKLDRKAREEGHEDLDALKKAYADKIQAVRKQRAVSSELKPTAATPAGPSPPSGVPEPTLTSATARGSTTSSSTSPKPSPQAVKPLSAFLDLPKARTLPVTELTAVWRLRHANTEGSLCAVIPARTYAAMEAAARRSPQFVLPVPRDGAGAEIHFLQWAFDRSTGTGTVLFTRLAEYKAHGEFALPHTSVTHHADLAQEKGVVLMQGNVVEGRGASVEDARWLVLCLQRFYGGWDGDGEKAQVGGASEMARQRAEERRRLLEWFGKGDERFSVEKLIEEAERLG